MSTPRVLFVGIGNMGAALARTLQAKVDHPISIWNRTKDRPLVKVLIEKGASFQGDITLAIKESDVIIICVLDYDTIDALLEPLNDDKLAFSGKTVVNLTNGTLIEATKSQQWMKDHGASRYYDGAVMVTPQLVGTPESFILYSGETKESFDSDVLSLVTPLGSAYYTGQDVDSAAAHDLAALSTMYGMFAGVFTGIGILKKQVAKSGAKIPIKKGVDNVVVPMMTAMVPYLSLLAQTVDDESYDDNAGSPVGMQLVGLGNILKAAEQEGVNSSALEHFRDLMKRVVDGEGPDGSVAEIVRYSI